MSVYIVKFEFIATHAYLVKADTAEEAIEIIEEHIRLDPFYEIEPEKPLKIHFTGVYDDHHLGGYFENPRNTPSLIVCHGTKIPFTAERYLPEERTTVTFIG